MFLELAYERVGRYPEAITCQQDSLIIKRQLGDRRGEAEGLRDLGDALHALGRHDDARAAWQQALTIYEQLQIPEAAEIHARLTALPAQAARLATG
jgi:tetratricopeptide (TPR) repeat protein